MDSNYLEEMINLCQEMLQRSHCVYSNFPVAAVLITECANRTKGCNVENSSYGLSICAERTAAVKAVSEGYLRFKECFVLTKSKEKIPPCGACRQFLSEFGVDLKLYLVSQDRGYIIKTLDELLPMTFSKKDIDDALNNTP